MTNRKQQVLRYCAIVLFAAGVAGGLARTNWLRSLENFYYDYWYVLSGVRYQPVHTARVVVDDDTLRLFQDDPLAFWAPHFARAMNVLDSAGVRAVGLDILYQVSAESWLRKLELPDSEISRNYESSFREALARGGKILISNLVQRNDGQIELLLPPQDHLLLLPGGTNDLGIANLIPDDDKRVRHFYPVVIPDPSVPGLSFALQLALRGANEDPSRDIWQISGVRLTREPSLRAIGFAGPPGTIPAVSMRVLMQERPLADPRVKALKGKIVIIGADSTSTPDRHFTTYSRDAAGEQMSGGEIHANIVETILSGRYPKSLSLPAEIVYLLAVLTVGVFLFARFSVGKGGAVFAAMALLVPLPAFLLLRGDWVLPVAEPQFALALAYVMTVGTRLAGEERERIRIRKVFGRYVSDEVVDKLLAEGRQPDLRGEALSVTVLFSDIRGFTTMSEKLSAHEVVEMLNAYFTRACAPILGQGGTVDKYIGDAVMAVFGSPVRHPDHAVRALRAAVGMAREAEEFREWMRKRFPERDLPEFAIGVGVHTGEAVIGDIGTPKRMEFTAIGDTVNAASRLEGVTKNLKFVIAASEACIVAAGPHVQTGRVERVTVKGRSEPILVYEVLGANS